MADFDTSPLLRQADQHLDKDTCYPHPQGAPTDLWRSISSWAQKLHSPARPPNLRVATRWPNCLRSRAQSTWRKPSCDAEFGASRKAHEGFHSRHLCKRNPTNQTTQTFHRHYFHVYLAKFLPVPNSLTPKSVPETQPDTPTPGRRHWHLPCLPGRGARLTRLPK